MAYDRLLERLYLAGEGWIIKGATALLARDIGVRGTIGIDLYREVAREIAEAGLRQAAAVDIGDWFRFEIGPPRPLADTGGVRLPVKALVGNTEWAAFHADLVGEDLRMTGDPEEVPPLARVVMPDVQQHGYRAYPLADHVADTHRPHRALHQSPPAGRAHAPALSTNVWVLRRDRLGGLVSEYAHVGSGDIVFGTTTSTSPRSSSRRGWAPTSMT